jgi:hypothetical protein
MKKGVPPRVLPHLFRMILETNKPFAFKKRSRSTSENRGVHDDVARSHSRFTRTSKRMFRIAPYENTRGFDPFFRRNGNGSFETVRKVTTEYSVAVLVLPILLQ